ncbi:MAG: hypothetical protein CMJ06_03555 [Pelagibacterales bacterium]|nr:hypothetical protein [Pelagibacterales bacterium]OUU62231.1 MAG: hypothetical protein CBC22_05005 [Alphaproteobacteria bacterium TMED62]
MHINKNLIISLLWLVFFTLIFYSWLYVYNMYLSMGLSWTGKKDMSMEMHTMNMSSMISLKMLFLMWSIMMIAMMLPAMIPTFRSYQDLIKSANGTWLGWIGVLFGYITIWIGFAFSISLTQVLLTKADFLNGEGVVRSNWLISALIIFAGIFQFSSIKDICHGVCIAPFVYFMKKWRPGLTGGLKMGLGLGIYCVGCCWVFMFLAFAMGYMNFLWMGLITLIVILEKIPQIGQVVKKPLGILLLIVGVYLAFKNSI